MTPTQEAAGLAAMTHGSFQHKDIRQALMRANVPIYALEDAVDALLRQEREAGHIRLERIDDAPITEDDRWIKV